MTIVDSHVHIGRDDLISEPMRQFLQAKNLNNGKSRDLFTAEGLIESMDKAGIELSVVFPLSFPNCTDDLQKLNGYTCECTTKYPDRLIGFGIIYPQDIPASINNLTDTINADQLHGIKIHPSMQSVYINDPILDPLYDFASKSDIPVLFHCGAGPTGHSDRFSSPLLVEDVLIKHPSIKVILAHLGRPFYDETAYILRKYSNAFADVSANVGRVGGPALLRNTLLYMQVYAGAAERLFFGTDYPIFSQQAYKSQTEAAVEGGMFGGETINFSQEEINGILGNNILRLLKKD